MRHMEEIEYLNAENGNLKKRINELEVENKSLRYNLEDWKHKAEEMELTAKSFVAEIALSHERIKDLARTLEPWGCKITYDGKEYTWSIVGIKDGEDGATH